MRNLLKPFLLTLTGLILLSSPLSAQIPSYGIIANVRGKVMIEQPGKGMVKATNGMRITQDTTITTDFPGNDGSALLLFPNGASMLVQPETTFTVQEFQMSADPNRRPDSPFLEPGQSTTVFDLEDGRIVGNINRLNPVSRLDVNTPVGYARVLGTQFVIEVTQLGANTLQIAYYLSKGQIRVDTIPNPDAGIQGGRTVLNPGEKLIVQAQWNPDGTIKVIAEPEQGVLTPEEEQLIQEILPPEAPVVTDVNTPIDSPDVDLPDDVDAGPTGEDDVPPTPEDPGPGDIAGPEPEPETERPTVPTSGDGTTSGGPVVSSGPGG